MSDSSHTDPARGEQPDDDPEQAVIDTMNALTVHLHKARKAIASLLELSQPGENVLTSYGEEGLPWGNFHQHLTAWRYQLDHAEGVLHSEFTPHVERALADAGMNRRDIGADDDDEGDNDDGDNEGDEPTLPPWLRRGQRFDTN